MQDELANFRNDCMNIKNIYAWTAHKNSNLISSETDKCSERVLRMGISKDSSLYIHDDIIQE